MALQVAHTTKHTGLSPHFFKTWLKVGKRSHILNMRPYNMSTAAFLVFIAAFLGVELLLHLKHAAIGPSYFIFF